MDSVMFYCGFIFAKYCDHVKVLFVGVYDVFNLMCFSC